MMAGNYLGHKGPPLEFADAYAIAKRIYPYDYQVRVTLLFHSIGVFPLEFS
jgi:hypothetical protein